MSAILLRLVVLLSLATSTCLAWEQGEEPLGARLAAAGYNEPEVAAFLKKIQGAVQADDARALAGMVHYPFSAPGKFTAKDRRAFIKQYEGFVTPRWKAAVVAQRYEDLFVNYQGIMVGNGEVWFGRPCTDKDCTKQELKIIAFNADD